MLELIVILGLLCEAPEPPPDDVVAAVLQTGWPSEAVYGASPYDLPTAPSEDGVLSYRIIVDPLYESYELCFYAEVKNILTDARSWPDIREAKLGETPQIWIILTPPGGAVSVVASARGAPFSGSRGTRRPGLPQPGFS